MQIVLEKETEKKISTASEALGIRKKELIDRAIVVYLDSLRSYLDLKKEMNAWDKLSDEAFSTFEKSV